MKVVFLFPVIDTVAMQCSLFTSNRPNDNQVTHNKQMKSINTKTHQKRTNENLPLAGGENIIDKVLLPGTKSNSHNNNNNDNNRGHK